LIIVVEIEQLLGPEERAILQQNVKPNLGKISTVSIENIEQLPFSPLFT
jgi:hypothetical protein